MLNLLSFLARRLGLMALFVMPIAYIVRVRSPFYLI
jgi:hypothetical protein